MGESAERSEDELAPAPEFRYVGFAPGPRFATRIAVGAFGAGASGVAAWLFDLGVHQSVIGALLVSSGLLYALRTFGGPARSALGVAAPIAVVPWGILIEDERTPRVLRWAAIRRVRLQSVYGRDEGTPSTLWSFIDVETPSERWSGRAPGSVPLEGLLANLAAYTRESSATIALDLDGDTSGEGPIEPDVSPLLAAAEGAIHGSKASSRLAVPQAGYRGLPLGGASPETVSVLRETLRSREARDPDPRPFAAAVAGYLGARALVPDLLSLVHSPHPLVAAVARAAAQRIGVSGARAGKIDELAPFLHAEDVSALEAWIESGSPNRPSLDAVPTGDDAEPAAPPEKC